MASSFDPGGVPLDPEPSRCPPAQSSSVVETSPSSSTSASASAALPPPSRSLDDLDRSRARMRPGGSRTRRDVSSTRSRKSFNMRPLFPNHLLHPHGHLDPNDPILTSRKARTFRSRVARFTASWFSVTMGTGICGTLLYLLPWGGDTGGPHHVLRAIAAAFWLLDMIIFLVFTGMSLLRYWWFPEIFRVMIQHEMHSLFLGTIPMGFVTIVGGIAALSNDCGLPQGFIILSVVLWWLALVMSCLTAFGVPWAMFTLHAQKLEKLTAAWLLPIVPPVTVATNGAGISRLMMTINPTHALAILLASYTVLGIGLLLSVLVLAAYFLRLAVHHLPPREVMISTFLPLGPCGQGGYALIELGRTSRDLFPVLKTLGPEEGGEAVQIFNGVGEAMYGSGVVWGFLFWGLGMWWLFIAVMSVGTALWRRDIAFNMGWWAFTFPLGSMTLLTLGLGQAFNSPFFKVVGTIFTGCVVSLWLVCAVPTARGWWSGSLFQAPCLTSLPTITTEKNTPTATVVVPPGEEKGALSGIANGTHGKEDQDPAAEIAEKTERPISDDAGARSPFEPPGGGVGDDAV